MAKHLIGYLIPLLMFVLSVPMILGKVPVPLSISLLASFVYLGRL